MSDPDLTKFQQRLAERRAKEAAAAQEAVKSAAPEHDDDLVPDVQYERSDADAEMDRVIESIDIIDAYNRWCGKMKPIVKGNQREGIKISCPIPTHPDRDPSAWINLDEQVWFCGGCQIGGDTHDIAAYHFNFPVPAYKSGQAFHELRQKMAEDFGFTITKLPGGAAIVTAPEPEDEPEEPESELESAKIIQFYDSGDQEIILPSLNWRPVVPEDTFLDAYMKATILDDVPEEYHFFHGLIALGFALGRDVRLSDFVPVYGNLFVCTLGRSGVGKSKAARHLNSLLTSALPHDWTDPNSKGVRKISSPGSAESLIHNFQKPVEDPANPKKIAYYAPVRGLIDFNELSSLVGRANRQGSVLTPTLMEFYDMQTVIGTSSMTHGTKQAASPFASALTTTQPRSLRNLVSKADESSGFLNRWVFVPGTEKKRFAIGGAQVDIGPAIKPLQDIAGWAASFSGDEYVEWSNPAAQLFTEFFHDQIEPDKKKSNGDLLTRMDLLMKKLILLFSSNQRQKIVEQDAVESAMLCYSYLISSYAIPEGQIGNTLGNEVSEAILYQVRRITEANKRGATLNDIAKSLKNRKYPMELLLKNTDALVKLGFLQMVTSKPGSVGRPSTRYKYVD